MNIKDGIKSQYHATLDMIRQVILKCPDPLWEAKDSYLPYWRIAFHALFFTHLYLQITEKDFVQWSKHRDQAQFLGQLPWPPHDEPKIGNHYLKEELVEYIEFCHAEIDVKINITDLDKESGFGWLPFDKLELQFYNIRHLQHHVGELSDRLGRAGVEIDWVGMAHSEKNNT